MTKDQRTVEIMVWVNGHQVPIKHETPIEMLLPYSYPEPDLEKWWQYYWTYHIGVTAKLGLRPIPEIEIWQKIYNLFDKSLNLTGTGHYCFGIRIDPLPQKKPTIYPIEWLKQPCQRQLIKEGENEENLSANRP